MKVEKDKVVFIHIETTDQDGVIIESTREKGETLSYIHGHGNLMSGIEDCIDGKEEGFRSKVDIKSDDSFGEYHDDLNITVDVDTFSDDVEIHIGSQVKFTGPDGDVDMYIRSINEDKTITLDGNHPLAGLDLIFDVEVVSVTDAHADEIKHSRVHPVSHNIMVEDSSF